MTILALVAASVSFLLIYMNRRAERIYKAREADVEWKRQYLERRQQQYLASAVWRERHPYLAAMQTVLETMLGLLLFPITWPYVVWDYVRRREAEIESFRKKEEANVAATREVIAKSYQWGQPHEIDNRLTFREALEHAQAAVPPKEGESPGKWIERAMMEDAFEWKDLGDAFQWTDLEDAFRGKSGSQ